MSLGSSSKQVTPDHDQQGSPARPGGALPPALSHDAKRFIMTSAQDRRRSLRLHLRPDPRGGTRERGGVPVRLRQVQGRGARGQEGPQSPHRRGREDDPSLVSAAMPTRLLLEYLLQFLDRRRDNITDPCPHSQRHNLIVGCLALVDQNNPRSVPEGQPYQGCSRLHHEGRT